MKAKIGFIGAGRMAGAMIKGLIARNVYTPDEIVACAPSKETRDRMTQTCKIKMYEKAADLVDLTDVLVLAIKPKLIASLFKDEGVRLEGRHLLISIAAGVKLKTLQSYAPEARIVRVMPNHCCMVLEGGSGYVIQPGGVDGYQFEKKHCQPQELEILSLQRSPNPDFCG